MRKSPALDALFPKTRQGLLAAMLLDPERRWYAYDLARHLGVSPSSLERELPSMVRGGILRRQRDGNRVYYQPDPSCPFLQELRGVFAKTAVLADILREALSQYSREIDVAFIYGSLARGEELSASDIDLLIVGDVPLKELATALREVEKTVRRSVNPAIYSPTELARKIHEANHFLRMVLKSEKIFLHGGQDELDAACGGPQG